MDLFVFAVSSIFVDRERATLEEFEKDFRTDRFGYSWKFEE